MRTGRLPPSRGAGTGKPRDPGTVFGARVQHGQGCWAASGSSRDPLKTLPTSLSSESLRKGTHSAPPAFSQLLCEQAFLRRERGPAWPRPRQPPPRGCPGRWNLPRRRRACTPGTSVLAAAAHRGFSLWVLNSRAQAAPRGRQPPHRKGTSRARPGLGKGPAGRPTVSPCPAYGSRDTRQGKRGPPSPATTCHFTFHWWTQWQQRTRRLVSQGQGVATRCQMVSSCLMAPSRHQPPSDWQLLSGLWVRAGWADRLLPSPPLEGATVLRHGCSHPPSYGR